MAECISLSVDAMTRAAKVLAFSSWSAWRISATSSARVAVSDLEFTPFSMRRKFAECDRFLSGSTIILPLRIRSKMATIMAICEVSR